MADTVIQAIAPTKHNPKNPFGPNIVTHERVLGNFTVPTPFGTFNANPSELHQVRPLKGGGVELVQVVDPDGATGLELVFWRAPLLGGWRVELQGPGVYGGPGGAPLPLSARAVGVGLTRDWVDEDAHEAASVTVELKLMEGDILRLAGLVGPGVAEATAKALKFGAESAVSNTVGEILAAAVPIASVLIALSTARWAVRRVRDANVPRAEKILAVAHALADAVRVVFPMPGVIANVALVGVAIAHKWLESRPRRANARPAVLTTGPPRG